MMFLKKSSVIALFRIIATLFVVAMLFIFLRIALTDKEQLSETEYSMDKSSRNDAIDQHELNEQHDRLLLINTTLEGKQAECKTSNVLYYASALILGAYANFSKLYKLGPI